MEWVLRYTFSKKSPKKWLFTEKHDFFKYGVSAPVHIFEKVTEKVFFYGNLLIFPYFRTEQIDLIAQPHMETKWQVIVP